MARASAGDLAHGLKGAKFPATTRELVEQAQHNKAAGDIVKLIDQMPDTEFGSIAEVEHAFGQIEGNSGSREGAAGAARKGGKY